MSSSNSLVNVALFTRSQRRTLFCRLAGLHSTVPRPAPLRSLPLHCRLRFDGVFRIEILFVLCRNVASVGVTDCGVSVCFVCGLCCVAVVNQTAA